MLKNGKDQSKGVSKLKFEILQKTHFLVFSKKVSKAWRKFEKILPPPNPWVPKVSGTGCMSKNVGKKRQNHCTVQSFI
jgi:hypothetical protein